MKIGILTFHKAYNYGAFLQCYSLQKRIATDFPNATVEVINYASQNMINSYQLSYFESIFGQKGAPNRPSLGLIVKRIGSDVIHWKNRKDKQNQNRKRINNFSRTQQYLPLSKQHLISDDPVEFACFIDQQHYDVIIVGSDAVWNDNQTSYPNLYYLKDVHCNNKMSYAASTYGMDFSSFDQVRFKYVKDALTDFKFIGTRDNVTEDYVIRCNEELQKKLYHTCDPSIFLDLEALPQNLNEIKRKLMEKGVTFDKPIIGLMCDNWLVQKVRSVLGEGFLYVSVYVYAESADIFLDDLEPFEWARVFSMFSATFTHYFHGTLFSIKNGTLTYAIEKNSKYNSKYKTKIQDVLSRLQLLDTNYFKFDEMSDFEWEAIADTVRHADREYIRGLYKEKLTKEASTYNVFKEYLEEVAKC